MKSLPQYLEHLKAKLPVAPDLLSLLHAQSALLLPVTDMLSCTIKTCSIVYKRYSSKRPCLDRCVP